MDKIDLIYNMLSDLRDDNREIRKDITDIRIDLNSHIEGVVQCRKRLTLLEKQALKINWKTITAIVSFLSALAGLSFYVAKLMGKI